jgi:hypothetical protein
MNRDLLRDITVTKLPAMVDSVEKDIVASGYGGYENQRYLDQRPLRVKSRLKRRPGN